MLFRSDNIDRFGTYRIYEALENAGFSKLSLDEKNDFVNKRLEDLHKLKDISCATDTAERLWQKRLGYQIDFFSRLKKQLVDSLWWSIHNK